MFNKDLVEEYIEIVKKNKDDYYKDYLEMVDKANSSEAIYHGKPIPITYQGMFISKENKEDFERIAEMTMNITRKVTENFLKDETYRKLFKFSEYLEDLILTSPGYDIPVPICRYDIFYNDIGDFKFCEFNTDGSSAMNEDSTLGRIQLETKAFKEFSKKHTISQFELFDSWVQKAIEIYRENGGREVPNVAIVDFNDLGTTNEFQKYKRAFLNSGYPCEIVDIRDIEYRNNSIYYKDYKIDLVYRRAVTMDILARLEEISDFIRAYKNGAFMMLGSFRSQIMHSKLIFKILRLNETKAFLNEEERLFIDRHIPFTEEFLTKEDLDLVVKNKDKYILKPIDGYASYRVYAGREYNSEDWEKTVGDLLAKGYIYQEYFDVDKVDFVEYDEEGSFSVSSFSFVLGIFIYKEHFQGLYTRIGNQALISGARRYYTTPNFLVE